MRIRAKVLALLIMIAVFIVGGIALYRTYEKMTLISIFQNEEKNKEISFNKIIALKGDTLETLAYDYTYWNEMVDFTINRSEEWASQNLGESTLSTYKANALWVYNKDFSCIYSINNNETGDVTGELPLSREMLEGLFANNKLFCYFFLNTPQGLIEIRGASIHPSADTERKTPASGYFFAGRLWNQNYIDELAKITTTKITVFPGEIRPKAGFEEDIKNGIISFSRTVTGWDGNPVAYFNIQSESVLIRQFNRTSRNIFITLIFITAGGIFFIFAFFTKWIYFPLWLISRALKTDKLEFISGLRGKQDEFGDISRLMHTFFEQRQTLIRTQEELKLEKEHLEIKVKERTLELEKANQELAEKAKELGRALKVKSKFLANMSHELRTPLNSVIGFSEILYDRTFGPLNETQQEYVRYVLTSGKHLLSLINDVLDFSRMDSEKMKLTLTTFCLKDVLEESLILIKEMAMKHTIETVMEIEEDSIEITSDERLLKQILYNLLSNAIKFTPHGGKVGIRVKTGDNEIEIIVWDTGIGIDTEYHEKIFEEFFQIENVYTKKYEGTGLGLSLVKKMVELLGGKIWVESRGAGKGSAFKFTVPMGERGGR